MSMHHKQSKGNPLSPGYRLTNDLWTQSLFIKNLNLLSHITQIGILLHLGIFDCSRPSPLSSHFYECSFMLLNQEQLNLSLDFHNQLNAMKKFGIKEMQILFYRNKNTHTIVTRRNLNFGWNFNTPLTRRINKKKVEPQFLPNLTWGTSYKSRS